MRLRRVLTGGPGARRLGGFPGEIEAHSPFFVESNVKSARSNLFFDSVQSLKVGSEVGILGLPGITPWQPCTGHDPIVLAPQGVILLNQGEKFLCRHICHSLSLMLFSRSCALVLYHGLWGEL